MPKVVLITGSSGAIGAALVGRFADAGWLVIGIDSVASPKVSVDHFIRADLNEIVVDPAYAESVFSLVESWLGRKRLNAIVNNAAYQYVSNSHPISVNEIERSIRVNAIAPYMLFCALKSHMVRGGHILNIGSIHSRLTKPGFLAYAMSKSALASLTRSLALDFGGSFSINCIEPASIETQMLIEGFQGNATGRELLDAYHPVGRVGKPSEVAELAFMIASSAIPFLQGACIDLSGGVASRLHDPG